MDVVIGGAYQGKLEYARRTYALTDEDLFFCTPEHPIDPGKRCICRLEEYVLGCVRRGEQPEVPLRPDGVILCRDISCGVVPMEAELRVWREAVGTLLGQLSRQAESVTRLFYGIPQALK